MEHNVKQKTHYDRVFRTEEAQLQLASDFKDLFLRRALERCRLQPGENILEVGCGHGVMTSYLLAAGCNVSAIDISEAGIEALRTRFASEVRSGQLRAQVTDVDAFMQANPGRFCRVVGGGVLHHLEDLSRTMQLASHTLVDGGKLFFAPEPNATGMYAFWWRYLAEPVYRLMGANFEWEVEKGTLNITLQNLRRILEHAGFGSIRLFPYQVLPHFRLRVLRAVDSRLVGARLLAPLAMYLSIYAEKRP